MREIDIYSAREIENGRYFLFGVECPTAIMAAYERLCARVGVQINGDRILAWVVTTTLVTGNMAFGEDLMDALERLGWRRPG